MATTVALIALLLVGATSIIRGVDSVYDQVDELSEARVFPWVALVGSHRFGLGLAWHIQYTQTDQSRENDFVLRKLN